MMPASLWSDPGTWVALGVSALFLVVAWAMHRVIVKVLKAPPPDGPHQPHSFAAVSPPSATATPPHSNESKTP